MIIRIIINFLHFDLLFGAIKSLKVSESFCKASSILKKYYKFNFLLYLFDICLFDL